MDLDTLQAKTILQRQGRATRNELGRTQQKSFFTSKEMSRQMLLAKAEYEMTYDAIINEALEDWFAAKKVEIA